MVLVIDIGNTRVKWALADASHALSEADACLHTEVTNSALAIVAKKATGAFVANVSNDEILNKIKLLIYPLPTRLLQVASKVCGVENGYEQANKLGADRWAAAIAAWHITQKSSIIVNAGTAVTIDMLNSEGAFLGGTIQPGLRLMQQSLTKHTEQLQYAGGNYAVHAKNTADAMTSGCINAIIGAILMNTHRQAAHNGAPPAIFLTGGDADKIAFALELELKQSIITIVNVVPNLVLQGLAILATDI